MNLTREYVTIILIMITEVLGFSLILPFLPFYAQEFGATPIQIGMILTSFSFFQFLSAPVMGRLSDHYGRRPLLILSQLSTMVSFVILGFANSLWMIFLSRIVDGMLGSNFTIAQAYLSDISSNEDRTKAFSVGGIAFGIGFLIGPGVGGFLASIDYSIPSFIAAGITCLTILITFFVLPETVKRKKKFTMDLRIFHLDDFRRYFKKERLSYRFLQLFTYILAHVIWTSSFALYAERQIGLGTIGVGYLLTYIGLISIILRGGVLPRLIDMFGENVLKYVGTISIIIGMIGTIFISSWEGLILVATFYSFGSGMVRPIMSSNISRSVSHREQGAVMGVSGSLGSLAQIIGPLVGGYTISYFSAGVVGAVSAAVMIAGLIFMMGEEMKYGNFKLGDSLSYFRYYR